MTDQSNPAPGVRVVAPDVERAIEESLGLHGRLVFTQRKAIADKLGVPMNVAFNAIVRETCVALAAPAPRLTDGRIGEIYSSIPMLRGSMKFSQAFARAIEAEVRRVAPAIYVECCECQDCGHAGLNDSDGSLAHCNACMWVGPSPKKDCCPECLVECAMGNVCPKCQSGRYTVVASALIDALATSAVPADASDPCAATRRAITRAAAAMAESKDAP